MKLLFIVFCILFISIHAKTSLNIVKKGLRETHLSQKDSRALKIAYQGKCKDFFKQEIRISELDESGCLSAERKEGDDDLNADVQCFDVKINRSLVSILHVYKQGSKRPSKRPYIVSIKTNRPIMSSTKVYARRPLCEVSKSVCNPEDGVVSKCENPQLNFDKDNSYILNKDVIYTANIRRPLYPCFVGGIGTCCNYINMRDGVCPNTPTSELHEFYQTSSASQAQSDEEDDEEEITYQQTPAQQTQTSPEQEQEQEHAPVPPTPVYQQSQKKEEVSDDTFFINGEPHKAKEVKTKPGRKFHI